MTDREAMRLALDALQEALKIDSLKDSRKFELVTAPKAMAALRQALDHVPDTTKMIEPDIGIDRGAWADVPDATKWVDELRGGDETEQEPVACKHNRYSVDVHEQTGTCYDCGAEGRMRFVVDDTAPPKQPECNKHPDAPHGFNRESSHSLGRYVCDCEGWEPEEQEPVAWWNPRYGKGEYAFAEEQSPPDDSNDPSDFGWNIPLYTAPPKPAQDLIVGYADSHDLNRDGHDFWVSRQPGKNTVPLYLYGHPPKIWQGLTDEEEIELDEKYGDDFNAYIDARDAKLKEKNI